MLFGSQLAPGRKIDAAVILTLALLDVLVRGGERVGICDVTDPTGHRDAAERAARALSIAAFDRDDRPSPALFKPLSDAVFIGDFLGPLAETEAWLQQVAARRVRGHLVETVDPAEESFPFTGRTEFVDPETGGVYVAGKAEELREAYRTRMAARRQRLREFCAARGWTYLTHHTDRPAQAALLALHSRLGAASKGISA